ncbi:Cullin repeat-like-containing domain protein [Xylariales sp. PMI_506]|nr:Cullin repeat-like-containing domain protein [Xylariales sp. PMI_506]
MSQNKARGKLRAPRRGAVPVVDAEHHLKELEHSILCILQGRAGNLVFEQIYRAAYRLTLQKRAQEAYQVQLDLLQTWVGSLFRETVGKGVAAYGKAKAAQSTSAEEREVVELRFMELKQAWEKHRVQMGMVREINTPLIRSDFPHEVDVKGLDIFRDYFETTRCDDDEHAMTVRECLLAFILEQIERDRGGPLINTRDLIALVQFMREILSRKKSDEKESVMLDPIETDVIEHTQLFYRDEAEVWLRNTTVGAYCRNVSRRLTKEKERSTLLLGELMAEKIVKVAGEEFIGSRLEFLVDAETGVELILLQNRMDELDLLVALADSFRRSPIEKKVFPIPLLSSRWKARILYGEDGEIN